jgi:hypothetical protein
MGFYFFKFGTVLGESTDVHFRTKKAILVRFRTLPLCEKFFIVALSHISFFQKKITSSP